MASHREVRMEDQYTLFMSEIDKKERDEKNKLRGHGFEQSPGTSRKRNAQDGVKFGVPKKLQQQLGKQMLGIMMQTKNNPEQKPSSDQLKQVMLLMQQEFNQQWDKQKTELDTKETPPPPLPSASPPPPPPPPPPLPQSEKNRWRPPSPPYPPPSSSPLSNTHGRHSSLTSSAATSSSAGPSITQFKSLPLPPHELLKKKKQDPVKKSSSQVCSSKTLNQASYLSEKRKQLPVSHSISSSSQLSNETSKTQLKGEKRSHVPSLTLEQTNLYEFMKSQLKTGNESDHSHPMQSLTERDSLFARFKQSVPSQSASDMFIQRYKTPSNIGSLTHDDEIPKQHCEQDNKHTDEGKPSKKMIEQTMNLIECGLKSGNLTGAKAIQLKEVHKQLATHLGRLGGSSQHGDLKQKRDAGNFKSSESHFEKRTSPVILTTQQSEVQSSAQKYKLSSAPVEVPSGIGMMTSSHGHSGVGIMDSSSGKGRSSSGQGTHGMRSSLPGPVGIGTMGSSDQGTRGMRGSLPGPGGIGTMGSSGRQSNMKMMSSSSSRQDGVGMMGSSSGQGAHEMMGSSSGQGPHGMMGSSSGQGPQGMMGSSSGQGPHGMMGSSSGQGPHGMMGSSSGQGPHGMMGSSSGQGPHGMMGSSSGQGPHGMMSLSGSHGGGAIMSDILKALSSSQDGAEKMRMLQSMPNHPDRAKLLAVALALCGVKGPDIFATLKKVMPDEESRTSSQQPTSHAVQAYGVKGASSKGHVPSLMSISLPSSEHTIEPCGSGLIGIPTKSESGDTRIDNISGSRDKPQSHDRPRERSESRGRSDSRLVERVVSSRNKSGPGYCELCKVHCGEWNLMQHVKGKKHLAKLESQKMESGENDKDEREGSQSDLTSSLWFCDICQLECRHEFSYVNHVKGRKHSKNLSCLQSGIPTESDDTSNLMDMAVTLPRQTCQSKDMMENKRKRDFLPCRENYTDLKKVKLSLSHGPNDAKNFGSRQNDARKSGSRPSDAWMSGARSDDERRCARRSDNVRKSGSRSDNVRKPESRSDDVRKSGSRSDAARKPGSRPSDAWMSEDRSDDEKRCARRSDNARASGNRPDNSKKSGSRLDDVRKSGSRSDAARKPGNKSDDSKKNITGRSSCRKENISNESSEKEVKKSSLVKWYCKICEIDCKNEMNFISHINGKQHATILADKPLPAVECKKVISDLTLFPYYCDICDVNCNHPSLLQVHVDGIKHKKLEAEIKMIEINEPILVEKKSSTDHIEWFCYKCQVDCKTSEMLKSHVKDSSHTQKKVQDKKVKDQVAALIKATNRVSLVDRLKKSIIPKTTGNRNQCLLCNVSVSGDTMMHRSGETHLANLDFHRKLAKLKNLLQQLGNARSGASALKLAVAYEERLSSDELVPPCKLCDLHDTDPKNFEKHINHQNHKDIKHFVETAVAIKKGIGSKDGDKIMAVIQEKEDNLFFEKPESTKWYCSICKELIRCPYEIHNIADSKHKGNKFLLEELVIALQDLKQLDFVKATIKMDPDEVKKETVVIEKKEEIETTVIKRKLFTEGKKDELSKYKVPKLGKDSKSEQRIKSESASDNAIESNKPKSIGTCSSTLDVSNVNKELGEDTTPATVEEHIDLSDMDELLIIDEFMSEPDEERNATDDSNKQTDDEHLDLNTSVGKDNSDPVLRKIQVKKSTTDEIESQSTDNFTTPKKDAMDKDSRSDSEKKTLAWQGKLTPLDEDKKEATLEAKQPDEVKIPTHDIPSTDEMNCQSNDFTLETKKQNEEKDSICDILSTDDTTHQRQNKEATSKAKQQNEEKDSICDIQSGKEHQKLNKDEIIKMKNCKVILVDIGKDIKKMCESIKHDGDEGDFGKYVDFSTMVTVDEIEDEEEDFSDGEEFMVMDEVGSSEDETTKKEFKMVQKYDKNRAIGQGYVKFGFLCIICDVFCDKIDAFEKHCCTKDHIHNILQANEDMLKATATGSTKKLTTSTKKAPKHKQNRGKHNGSKQQQQGHGARAQDKHRKKTRRR